MIDTNYHFFFVSFLFPLFFLFVTTLPRLKIIGEERSEFYLHQRNALFLSMYDSHSDNPTLPQYTGRKGAVVINGAAGTLCLLAGDAKSSAHRWPGVPGSGNCRLSAAARTCLHETTVGEPHMERILAKVSPQKRQIKKRSIILCSWRQSLTPLAYCT